jgi:hypothetical protein
VRGEGAAFAPGCPAHRTGETIFRAEPAHASFPFLPPRLFRMDPPCISIRCTLWTSRSRMLSAMVGSPIWARQVATGRLVPLVQMQRVDPRYLKGEISTE